MSTNANVESASLEQAGYWWYRARAELLRAALEEYIRDAALVLDVGSADGPSVEWLTATQRKISIDLDPTGLGPCGVCATALQLPFVDNTFDVVGAFDVVEHCDPEMTALAEMTRVLKPGGRLLISVPAYQWAWTDFDVRSGHHRRYTRPRAVAAISRAGLSVERATYAFSAVFPFFVAERAMRKIRPPRKSKAAQDLLPEVRPALAALLTWLCRVDRRLLRKRDLPFGSSVVVAATKMGAMP